MKLEPCYFCGVCNQWQRDNQQQPYYIFSYSEFFIAKISEFPVNPGHIELFPKRHVNSLTELNFAEQKDLFRIIKETLAMLTKQDFEKFYSVILRASEEHLAQAYCARMLKLPYVSDAPTGFNIGINQGEAAGQTVKHLHLHLIPRFAGEPGDPTGGVRNLLNNGLGNYKNFQP